MFIRIFAIPGTTNYLSTITILTLNRAQISKTNSDGLLTSNNRVSRGGKSMPAVPVLQQKVEQLLFEKDYSERSNPGIYNTGLLQSPLKPFQLKDERPKGPSTAEIKPFRSAPGQLQAHAFAQGTDIHIAPGQERHLPHEAWHVVQQRKGRVKPTMQLQANGPAQTVQRTIVPAKVVWGRTHIVKEIEGSIFGDDDYSEGETGPLGELTAGQEIIIEDDDIFISRRGANQEKEEIREEHRETKPSIPWVRVLEIDKVDVSSANVYVRAETVQIITGKVKKNSSEEFKKVKVTELDGWDRSMDLALHKMETEWILLGGNPNKPKSEDQCSGDTWGQCDEGADVAHELVDPGYRKADAAIDNYQRTFIAHYDGEDDPIAVMIVEMRHEDIESEADHLYIRWLVGSPTRKGGGSKLVGVAKAIAVEKAQKELRVESAFSAEEWYQRQGFVTKYNSTHNTLEECGCKFMTWTKEQS
jgi:hypothetical protein